MAPLAGLFSSIVGSASPGYTRKVVCEPLAVESTFPSAPTAMASIWYAPLAGTLTVAVQLLLVAPGFARVAGRSAGCRPILPSAWRYQPSTVFWTTSCTLATPGAYEALPPTETASDGQRVSAAVVSVVVGSAVAPAGQTKEVTVGRDAFGVITPKESSA